ncbi:copper amine oxidase N-terminal domain-containing protein [Peptoniphilus sp. AGMB00490]|uniref:Copper amine oxidase N-terminal domain-containing protein n=1 Tax=Peptoniphilus faecalis TaxID=2731255 RepID=A0A848RG61_9FIRM|nr:copper amine oxidase N-terminal domain-containing protein [Peptoniphilus faecalis]NMW84701.1 copper amine oxidase N-terminal domain-containing protein [Peptoniphilus faecalis]
MKNFKKASMAVLLSCVIVGNVVDAQSKDDIKIEINGKEVVSDVAPFIDNDRTLVPIRVISENLGYHVDWNNQNRKVVVKNSDKSIELIIGDKNVNVNGNKSVIDVAPVIKDERTFVPLRFIAENFDNNVNWDNNTRTVKIDKKESKKVASIVNTKDTNNNKKKIPTLNNTFTPITSKPIVETKIIREPQIIYVYRDKETTPSKNTTQKKRNKANHQAYS